MPTQETHPHADWRLPVCRFLVIASLAFFVFTAGGNAVFAHRHHLRPSRRSGWSRAQRALPSRGIILRRDGISPRVHIDATPITEVRAMWVVRDSIASPARIRNVIATAKHYGFNALFVQVRGRGDALYQSTLEPRAEELAGQDPAFDPLATVIAEAHAAHIQVHAWLNTCYVWGAGRRPYAPDHVVNAHPDWLARTADGGYTLGPSGGCEGAFLSPANLEARQHIHDVFLEVATKYDIDGIHFNYVRYSNQGYDYSPAALQGFAKSMNDHLPGYEQKALETQGALAYVHAFPTQFADWRRQQVTDMVASISGDVKKAKPWVVVSAAVFSDASDAYSARGPGLERMVARRADRRRLPDGLWQQHPARGASNRGRRANGASVWTLLLRRTRQLAYPGGEYGRQDRGGARGGRARHHLVFLRRRHARRHVRRLLAEPLGDGLRAPGGDAETLLDSGALRSAAGGRGDGLGAGRVIISVVD